MGFEVVGLDHVQLAMPPGGEGAAEDFYAGFLGFTRIAKPEPMASRGGCWFTKGPVALHLGVEVDFRPARKAHPALRLADGRTSRPSVAEVVTPDRRRIARLIPRY